MAKITLIGAGPGREELLTLQARRAIDESDAVFSFARHSVLGKAVQPLEPLATAHTRIAAAAEGGRRVSVLVSGDPCLYSLLGLLQKRLGRENITVLPGIGAVQAFCARMGVLWQDARILSGHGRALSKSALVHEVRTHKNVLLFCDATRGAAWAAQALCEAELIQVSLCVGERLSYPDEALTRGQPADLAQKSFDPLCLVWFDNPAPENGLPAPGLDDEAFTRGKIPMTKREIRMQVLSELALPEDAVVWDLGAGTGSVSVECARRCPYGEVYAVEQKSEGVALIRANAQAFHCTNLTAVEGVAPEACAALPAPTHVFIGGSGGQLGAMLEHLRGLGTPVKVVATAVTPESMAALAAAFDALNHAHMYQLSTARVVRAGRCHLLQALNPVFIASGEIS